MAKKTADKAPQVHATVIITADKLQRDPTNTQKQDRKTFNALRTNIREQGFDENLLVRSNGDGTYTIFSGNHRFEAGKAEGMTEFPCVIRDDWSVMDAHMQSVRRNYARGKIDKEKFSELVNEIEREHQVSMEEIYGSMGFSNVDDFAALYVKEQEEAVKIERTSNEAAPKVKLMDDLGIVLSHIFETYGDTVPFNFIIFPAGGKKHVFVQSSNALKKVLTEVMAACVEKGYDINTALAGLLQIGSAHTNFLKKDDKNKVVLEAAEELETDPGDTGFEEV
ncbi:MAG: hypothetical protein JWO15_3619 [Sphingomonadales bacterium]|nr:hypothetical protein [Sphingomonadales bacterium]